MTKIKEVHLGITNRCRLACLVCARNDKTSDTMQKIQDIALEDIKKFLLSASPRKVFFCGVYGDPIYHPDFIEIIRFMKQELPYTMIIIHTNGTGKKDEWWHELISLLTRKDSIYFAIDGSPENYHNYRINSKWSEVEQAVKACVKARDSINNYTKIIWKYLVFSFNEDTIYESYLKCKELGMSGFDLRQAYTSETTQWLKTTRPFSEIKSEFDELLKKD